MSKERKNPTVAEIIAYLERLPKDAEVRLSINDHYSTHGASASLMDFDMSSGVWNHSYNKDTNWVTLEAHINSQKPMTSDDIERFPKIMFRKQ